MPHHYLLLLLAIISETVATSALQASQQFTRLVPSVLCVVGYMMSFWLLALTLRHMPVGLVYAIWAGLGVVLISLIGLVVFGQRLDGPAILGLAMIIGGVVIIHLFSDSKDITH